MSSNPFSLAKVVAHINARNRGEKVYMFLRLREMTTEEIAKKLACSLSHVPDHEDECWLWGRSFNNKGYGRVSINGSSQYVHRAAYSLVNGKVPKGLEVMHSCDTPLCINPKHLSLGTHHDNMLDAFKKGHLYIREQADNRGSRNGMSKLTEKDVLHIRKMVEKGVFHRILAEKFGVTQSCISMIRSRRHWKHL